MIDKILKPENEDFDCILNAITFENAHIVAAALYDNDEVTARALMFELEANILKD